MTTERTFLVPTTAITYSMFCGQTKIKFTALADGPHSIMGAGYGIKAGDKFFTETCVFSMGDCSVDRGDAYAGMPDYSKLTDEDREANRQAIIDEEKKQQIARDESQKREDALVASAKAKLTEEEYEAVYNLGYGDGRG